jgi:Tfp pilus assembly protein PilE
MSLRGAQRRSNLNAGGGRLLRFARNDMRAHDTSPSCSSCSSWFSSLPHRRGVTLVEMAVAMLASSVLILGVTAVIAGSHKSFNQTYERVNGAIVRDAYVARRVFEEVTRKSSVRNCQIGTSNESAEVYYYSSNTAPHLDRYALFYVSNGNLMLERGHLDYSALPFEHVAGTETTQTVIGHVTYAYFAQTRPCLHMHLVLSDGNQTLPVVITAMRHNE